MILRNRMGKETSLIGYQRPFDSSSYLSKGQSGRQKGQARGDSDGIGTYIAINRFRA